VQLNLCMLLVEYRVCSGGLFLLLGLLIRKEFECSSSLVMKVVSW
jgi:hypothetical protein